LSDIVCTDRNTGAQLSTGGTVTPVAGQRVTCEVTNDDIAPTITVHKIVVNNSGGTALAANFQLTLNGAPIAQGVSSNNLLANTPSVISEDNSVPGYAPTGVVCTSDVATSLNNKTATGTGTIEITPALAENIDCTITNDDVAVDLPTITVAKIVSNQFGGPLNPPDFQLKIDGIDASQGGPHDVSVGAHTISETARPGYTQTGIVCVDLVTNATVGQGGSVNLVAGQDVKCTVTNADQPAVLTLTKIVNNDDGGNLLPENFQLKIDGVDATQGDPHNVSVGLHTLTEAPVAGYRLVAINCTDDVSHLPLTYNGGITLALGQHASCTMTNDDDPLDLAITKTNDGQVKIAGNSFDYTITVDNLGPRDARANEVVTVTDRLPAGFEFQLPLPVGCTSLGQVLTCSLDPAALQVADPAIVIIVTVHARADAVSGTYTNIAYVDTVEDPACVGQACVPVCGAPSNNIACASTQIIRQASLSILKVADVSTISPGQVFNYTITVSNAGPSTFLANLVMTDPLPQGLLFQSVTPGADWSCTGGSTVICHYLVDLQPGAAPPITIQVQLDPTFNGALVHNVATATAIVEPPASVGLALALALDAVPPPPADPGTVVTATDDVTTPIVRNANLSIAKSVSQTTATAGDLFNWILDITNHGPDTATNVVVSDTIPAQFEVIGTFPTTGLSCTNTGNAVQCTTAALANGATVRTVVQVRVLAAAAPGAVTNTATVTTDGSDSDTTDNTSSASITVTAIANQAPVPTPDPGTVVSGGTTLPRTGNSSLGGPLTLAALMVAGGIASLVIARRRRDATV
jgi:uncharacterized repeat protein (TIGR01451 family)/LPXTG-motif cell wall-anchored protein